MNSELTNNKQSNYNNVNSRLTTHDSPFTTHKRQLSWIIASLEQVAHFTSVVIRNVLATSGWVRSAHTAPYAKSAHNSLVKAIAFTLAETLVVMGIIGVVAALTIPNLNQSTGDREKVAKVKKIYANLEDAFGRATAVYGPIDEWFINLPEDISENQRLADRMTEFMKISKNCGTGSGCFADGEYPELGGVSSEEPNTWDEPKVLLADGTALDFYIESDDCSNDWGATSDSPVAKTCGLIYVDIDGPKGPNTLGKDYFSFYVTSTGIYPEGGKNSAVGKDNDIKSSCFFDGRCTGWVIETGNMDYLKANEGVCPNGTELSWENTSCK